MARSIINFFKYLLILFSIIILIINLLSFFSIYVLRNDYSIIFGYTYFEVSTGSMRDALKEQDIVVVKLNDNYTVGDIVTYESNGSFITHRVESIDNDTVITKGDANNISDSPIKREQIIGKVVKVLPNLGVIIKVITDKITIFFAIGIIIIISYLTSLKSKE